MSVWRRKRVRAFVSFGGAAVTVREVRTERKMVKYRKKTVFMLFSFSRLARGGKNEQGKIQRFKNIQRKRRVET